ncbi:MAG: hypothetical protein II106_00715, partial [Oscillospiraceae bacterium]|nr:hypothetical protein [Oscillospiraceae bacterium]
YGNHPFCVPFPHLPCGFLRFLWKPTNFFPKLPVFDEFFSRRPDKSVENPVENVENFSKSAIA